MPKTTQAQVLGKQILRSGTSVGANYWEATRARSNEEFISKTNISLQELEETRYWLELLLESGIEREEYIHPLQDEAAQLVAIFVTVIKRKKAMLREIFSNYYTDDLEIF